MTYDEISEFFPDRAEQWKNSFKNDDSVCFPGGECNTRHFARMNTKLKSFFRQTNCSRVVVVSHGRSIARFLAAAANLQTPPPHVANCALLHFRYHFAPQTWEFLGEL